jgi:quinol-cytochrome oxidoreductase complex cytochrome b subunit
VKECNNNAIKLSKKNKKSPLFWLYLLLLLLLLFLFLLLLLLFFLLLLLLQLLYRNPNQKTSAIAHLTPHHPPRAQESQKPKSP